MPTGLCGERSCEGPWLSSSAGTAPGSSISRCTAAPSRCGRPPFPPDRERDGVRPRPPQSPPLRPQSRPLAPRQRLAVRGRAGHVSPPPRATRGTGRRGNPGAGDDRIHAGSGEPAGEPRLRARDGGVLRTAPGRVRPGPGFARGDGGLTAVAVGGVLEVTAATPPGPVPFDRGGSRVRLSAPAGAWPPGDYRLRCDARLPAAPCPGRKHPTTAGGGPGRTSASVRHRAGWVLASGVGP